MITRAGLIWVAGLLTMVPYATYYLLFHAQPGQYALLITLVLFWIFGYWGVVGPLLAALKVRSVFRTLERATSTDELMKTLRSGETEEVAIEFIASENHIPRFIARRVYRLLMNRLSTVLATSDAPSEPAGSDEFRL